jgi:hypothetical protein
MFWRIGDEENESRRSAYIVPPQKPVQEVESSASTSPDIQHFSRSSERTSHISFLF